MANEAVKVELGLNGGQVHRYAVADKLSIEKGTLLVMDDGGSREVSGAPLTLTPPAGIAAEEKVAGDGRTSIGVYTEGIFDCIIGTGGCTRGALLTVSGSNYLVDSGGTTVSAGSIIVSGLIMARALETATENEVINVKLVNI